MRLFIVLFMSSYLFLTACVSSLKSNLLPLEHSNELYKLTKQITESCLKSENASFLATMVSSTSFPVFKFEGKWSDHYNILETNILDPMGNILTSVTLVGHNIIMQNNLNTSKQKELDKLLSVVSTLGAVGIRQIMCGYFAFHMTEKDPNLYISSNENNDEMLSFQSERTFKSAEIIGSKPFYNFTFINIDSHEITSKNKIILYKPRLFAISEFYYGPFSTKSNIELKWEGNISHEFVTTPKKIEFLADDFKGIMSFEDYE